MEFELGWGIYRSLEFTHVHRQPASEGGLELLMGWNITIHLGH